MLYLNGCNLTREEEWFLNVLFIYMDVTSGICIYNLDKKSDASCGDL